MAVREKPDLIILDISLPDIDGHEVACRLKASPETARIPVIVVTSYAMAKNGRRSLKAGANDYMSKSIDIKDLIVKVRKHIN